MKNHLSLEALNSFPQEQKKDRITHIYCTMGLHAYCILLALTLSFIFFLCIHTLQPHTHVFPNELNLNWLIMRFIAVSTCQVINANHCLLGKKIILHKNMVQLQQHHSLSLRLLSCFLPPFSLSPAYYLNQPVCPMPAVSKSSQKINKHCYKQMLWRWSRSWMRQSWNSIDHRWADSVGVWLGNGET